MEVLNFFSSIACLVFLTTQFYQFGVSEEMITIIRNPGKTSDPWTDLDEFEVTNIDSNCYNSYCTDKGALPVENNNCHCKCSDFKKATFGFYSGSWRCWDNTKVRKQAGKICNYKFQKENDNEPLRILESGTSDDAVRLPPNGCSVVQAESQYFTCDGRWAKIDSQSISKWFSIQYRSSSSHANGFEYVHISSNISRVLLGKIISLGIICQEHSGCLLFKLQGTFQCAENVTSIIPSPSSTIPTAKTSVTTQTAATPETAATPSPNATANPFEEKEKAETSGDSSTTVGVVVTLVIIVVIVIVIVAYVYRKRKRGEPVLVVDYISSRVRKLRSTEPKKKTREETKEDPEYAEIPEEQRRNEPVDQAGGIYSYAFDDPQTAYIAPQPASYNRLVHNQHKPDQEGTIYSTADDGPGYNVLERPLAKNHIMMTPQSTMNEGPHSQDLEPEYHVLEGPDTTTNEGPPSQDQEPEYHVLEGPDTTTNEGPPSQDLEPEYHVLEGPDKTDETTDSPFNETTDARASIGTANPFRPQVAHVAVKERRKPPSPPRKM